MGSKSEKQDYIESTNPEEVKIGLDMVYNEPSTETLFSKINLLIFALATIIGVTGTGVISGSTVSMIETISIWTFSIISVLSSVALIIIALFFKDFRDKFFDEIVSPRIPNDYDPEDRPVEVDVDSIRITLSDIEASEEQGIVALIISHVIQSRKEDKHKRFIFDLNNVFLLTMTVFGSTLVPFVLELINIIIAKFIFSKESNQAISDIINQDTIRSQFIDQICEERKSKEL